MINDILIGLFNRLQTANPMLFMVIVGILFVAWSLLEFLGQAEGVVLPPVILSSVSYIKALIVGLGFTLGGTAVANKQHKARDDLGEDTNKSLANIPG